VLSYTNKLLQFILKQIEISPACLFRESELKQISADDFNILHKENLLRYHQYAPEGDSYPCLVQSICGASCDRVVSRIRKKWEAVCLDGEADTKSIILTEDDITKYSFDIDNFLKQICNGNKFEGKLQRIDQKYFYLGYRFHDNQRIDFIFAFSLRDDKTLKLAGLKDIYKRGILVVLTPAVGIDDITIENRFNKEQVIQSALSDCLNPRTFELHLEKIFDRAVIPKKETSRITIKLIEIKGELNPDIRGEPAGLVQRLQDSYKLTAILICAKAYNSETLRSLAQLTNNLIRYGFKKGRSIRGRADLPSRVKNLEREVKTLNTIFEETGLSSPLIKESGIFKWFVEMDDFIRFEDERGTELKMDSLRNLLNKYKLFYRYKEPIRKLSRKSKIFFMSGDKMDYAANPSRLSEQRKLEGRKIHDDSDDDTD
jgi:hypothetical protein